MIPSLLFLTLCRFECPIMLTQKMEGWKYTEPPSNSGGLLEGGKPRLVGTGQGQGRRRARSQRPGSAAECVLEAGVSQRWRKPSGLQRLGNIFPKLGGVGGRKPRWTSKLRASSTKNETFLEESSPNPQLPWILHPSKRPWL